MIKLLFAGDFMPPETSECIYSEELMQLLKDKDFSIVNLEAPLTNDNNPIKKTGNNFKSPPETIRHIKDGYFDAVALSNNHIRDYGDQGVIDTLRICSDNNIQTVGAGRNIAEAAKPLQLNIKGKTISILNYSEREFNIASDTHAGANPFDLIDAFHQVKSEKEENDIVIVVYHGGLEYMKYPTPQIVKTFKYLADVGADAVIGHHTHFYSGMIEHQGKPLIFSLGNFFAETSTKNPRPEMSIGLLANLCIDEDNKVSSSLTPMTQDTNNKIIDLLNEGQKTEVLNDIRNISVVINNERELKNIWNLYYQEEQGRVTNILASDSKLEYRLRKRFPYLNKISSYKAAIVLNLMRCDSHRYKTIEILEKVFK
jgi:poly-gamma-glutamate capsule biosynthesis protein CapA/YwtB (metallophosphatase superfamily)